MATKRTSQFISNAKRTKTFCHENCINSCTEKRSIYTGWGPYNIFDVVIMAHSGNHCNLKYVLDNLMKDVNINEALNMALHEAAKGGNYENIKYLIDRNVDINKETHNSTALIEAAKKNHIEAVELLLENGASIDHVSRRGVTALMDATLFSKPEAVELLLKKGANKSIAKSDGQTALDIAYGRTFGEQVDKYKIKGLLCDNESPGCVMSGGHKRTNKKQRKIRRIRRKQKTIKK